MKTRLTQERLNTLAEFTRFEAQNQLIHFSERGEISAVDITKPETLHPIVWDEVFKMFGEDRADYFSEAQIEKIATFASQKCCNFVLLFRRENKLSARVIDAYKTRKKLIHEKNIDHAFDAPEFACGDPRAYGPEIC